MDAHIDLQVQVREGKQLFYKFYKKPVANHLLMLKSSAMPDKVKRSTLTEEGVRRLRNTKREIPWSEKAEILSEFAHKMMLSGYSQRFRLEIVKSAVAGYKKQVARSDAGVRPLHRSREWQQSERRKKKLLTKTSWYRPHNSVIFVPATPGAELAGRIKDAIKPDMERIGKSIKVVETGGVKLKDSIVKSDLTGCYWPDCLLCRDGSRGNHTRRGAVYKGICQICSDNGTTAIYDGESGHSGYQRVNIGHKPSIINNNQNNAFSKHLQLYHPDHKGDHSKFKFSLTTVSRTCLVRQITEGVEIHNSKATVVMNGKSEWHQPVTRRVEFHQEPRNTNNIPTSGA